MKLNIHFFSFGSYGFDSSLNVWMFTYHNKSYRNPELINPKTSTICLSQNTFAISFFLLIQSHRKRTSQANQQRTPSVLSFKGARPSDRS